MQKIKIISPYKTTEKSLEKFKRWYKVNSISEALDKIQPIIKANYQLKSFTPTAIVIPAFVVIYDSSYVIKVFRKQYTAKKNHELSVLKILQQFENYPKLVKCISGNNYFEDTYFNGFVQEYNKGNEVIINTEKDAFEVGKLLANFHLHIKDMDLHSAEVNSANLITNDIFSIDFCIKISNAIKNSYTAESIKLKMEKYLDAFNNSFKHGNIHGDFSSRHLIKTDGKFICYDFGEASPGDILIDLARVCAVKQDIKNILKLPVKLNEHIINGYNCITQLSDKEMGRLKILIIKEIMGGITILHAWKSIGVEVSTVAIRSREEELLEFIESL